MMPFIMSDTFNKSNLPAYLSAYWTIIKKCLNNDHTQSNKIGFLTIHESFVDAERTQTRPGLHVDNPGIIYSKINGNKNKQGSNFYDHNMTKWEKWGGGGHVECDPVDGIYMASNIDNSCAVWNCKIVTNDKQQNVIG
eukprot:188716_1